MTFERDPISEWFDVAARRMLVRAYADYGQWVTGWCPRPTDSQRAQAAALGINVDEADANEHTRWVRAFKRSARWNLRMYGYARELRPGRRRTNTLNPQTLMSWDSTAGLVMRSDFTRAYQVRVKLYPNTIGSLFPVPAPADDITRRAK